MRVEKHNSHGMQLLVGMHPEEALALARKLVESVEKYQQVKDGNNYYVSTPCLFEDDNGSWVHTDFDVVVGDNRFADCQPTYPCGKEIVQGGMNSAPEFCNIQAGHKHGCYRR